MTVRLAPRACRRVYLYREGFALFASDPYDAESGDRYAFITNAFVNRARAAARPRGGDAHSASAMRASQAWAMCPNVPAAQATAVRSVARRF